MNRLKQRRPQRAHMRVLVVARVILLRLLARLLEKHEPAGVPVRPFTKRARKTILNINGADMAHGTHRSTSSLESGSISGRSYRAYIPSSCHS